MEPRAAEPSAAAGARAAAREGRTTKANRQLPGEVLLMRLFAYALREYDELGYMREAASQMGFEFDWTS